MGRVDDAISADEIGPSFAPLMRGSVAAVEVDDEMVLLLDDEWATPYTLNQTASIVWRLFDGVATIQELSDDLSDAFAAEKGVVRNEVVELTRQLGKHGFLEGVAKVDPKPSLEFVWPEGLIPGTQLPDFELLDLDGKAVTLVDLRGDRLLLVNWNPGCSFCASIAPELAELQPELASKHTRIVLLAAGGADANRKLVEERGLVCTVLLLDDADVEFFTGLGTPSAYLTDEAGRVASDLAIGADLVPKLAREAAGEDR